MFMQVVSAPHGQTLLRWIDLEGKDIFREAGRCDADRCLTGGSARAGGLEPDGSGEGWETVSTENFCYISVQNYEFLWLEGATVGMRKMMRVK